MRPYQVWPRSEKDCTWESVNGLSRSKQLISSLSAHLTSSVSRDELVRDLAPRCVPTKSGRDRRRIAPGRALTGIVLISLLSAHLTSSVSHERTRPRSWPQVRPYQVWPRSEKNCTRESVNGDCGDRRTISFQYTPLSTSLSGGIKIVPCTLTHQIRQIRSYLIECYWEGVQKQLYHIILTNTFERFLLSPSKPINHDTRNS